MENIVLDLSLQQNITILASALGCGLLVGLERERSKNTKTEQSFAGLRSFTLVALIGALCFIFGTAIAVVGAVAMIAFCLYSLISQKEDIGSTTELAFLMTYFIGGLCVFNASLAAGLAVLLTVILMAKQFLHQIAGQWIRDYELRDGLFLLALILIALPLMPNKPLWGVVLNPYVILKLLILILVVQSLAHIAKRLLSNGHALILSSLASGFVSSTATIASFGMKVRAGDAEAKASAGAGLISCVSTLLQLWIVVVGINIAWFKLLIIPCLLGMLILMVVGILLIIQPQKNHSVLQQNEDRPRSQVLSDHARMFSIKEAVIIALTLAVIQAVVYGLNLLFGDNGLLIGTFLASLFEIHAAMAAVVVQGDISNMTLMYAMIIGLFAHACSKSLNAFLTGGWQYFIYFAPVQILHMICVIVALWMMI